MCRTVCSIKLYVYVTVALFYVNILKFPFLDSFASIAGRLMLILLQYPYGTYLRANILCSAAESLKNLKIPALHLQY